MKFFERLQQASKEQEAMFAECYELADGNQIKAKRLLRRRLFATYGIDPATIALIFALIQLAFKAWKWAKDNGFLASYNYQDVPLQAILNEVYNAGEFPESVDFDQVFQAFDDGDD